MNRRSRRPASRRASAALLGLLVAVASHRDAVAQPPAAAAGDTPPAAAAATPQLLVDLPGVLELAGTRSLDVRIAGERLAEAKAARKVALESFFPTIGGGIAYRRHDGAIQDVLGDVQSTGKDSYMPGATVTLQSDLGAAIFRSLEAKQSMNAAGHRVEAERQQAIAAAAAAYLDLVRSRAAVRTAEETAAVSTGYSRELDAAVRIGIASEADAMQARAKADDDLLAKRRAEEEARLASLKLATQLDLDADVVLAPRDVAPVRLQLPVAALPVEQLLASAMAARPELRQRGAEVEAAREAELGAKYGPLAPSLGGMVFAGGTGGGRDGNGNNFGDTQDYMVGLQWKLGPGGLFDLGRIEGSEARHRGAELEAARTRRRIQEEVLAARERVDSLADREVVAERALASARDALKLKQERRDFGVAAVLEALQAQRDWTRAMDTWLATVTEHDKAQYELLRASGGLAGSGANTPAALK